MKSIIQVANLKCGGCANTIRSNLLKLPDISTVNIDNESSLVEVDYTKQESLERIKQILSTIGYPEIHKSNSIAHKAKSYASCLLGRMKPGIN